MFANRTMFCLKVGVKTISAWLERYLFYLWSPLLAAEDQARYEYKRLHGRKGGQRVGIINHEHVGLDNYDCVSFEIKNVMGEKLASI